MATPQNGVVSFRVNGDVIRVAGNVTYSLGGLIREPKEGPTGLIGFSVKGMSAFCEVETIDAADVDLEALQRLTGATVTLQLQNGKTIVLNDASTVGRIEASSEDGAFTLRFEGANAKEV